MKRLVILNGASGSGKTTTARLAAETVSQLAWLHPDGLWPDTPELTAEAIFLRVAKRLKDCRTETVIADCQILPDRIDALLESGSDMVVSSVLLDCPREAREARLLARGWSDEGAFPRIEQWARLLFDVHTRLGLTIIDTAKVTPEDVCARIIDHVA